MYPSSALPSDGLPAVTPARQAAAPNLSPPCAGGGRCLRQFPYFRLQVRALELDTAVKDSSPTSLQ